MIFFYFPIANSEKSRNNYIFFFLKIILITSSISIKKKKKDLLIFWLMYNIYLCRGYAKISAENIGARITNF